MENRVLVPSCSAALTYQPRSRPGLFLFIFQCNGVSYICNAPDYPVKIRTWIQIELILTQGDHTMEANLTVANVAKIAGCHPNTLERYEKRGFLRPLRDFNGHRRIYKSDALKLL